MSRTLEEAIALVTDGRDVDWQALAGNAATAAERAALEDLRGLLSPDAATDSKYPINNSRT
jgi:hypothetical protein